MIQIAIVITLIDADLTCFYLDDAIGNLADEGAVSCVMKHSVPR